MARHSIFSSVDAGKVSAYSVRKGMEEVTQVAASGPKDTRADLQMLLSAVVPPGTYNVRPLDASNQVIACPTVTFQVDAPSEGGAGKGESRWLDRRERELDERAAAMDQRIERDRAEIEKLRSELLDMQSKLLGAVRQERETFDRESMGATTSIAKLAAEERRDARETERQMIAGFQDREAQRAREHATALSDMQAKIAAHAADAETRAQARADREIDRVRAECEATVRRVREDAAQKCSEAAGALETRVATEKRFLELELESRRRELELEFSENTKNVLGNLDLDDDLRRELNERLVNQAMPKTPLMERISEYVEPALEVLAGLREMADQNRRAARPAEARDTQPAAQPARSAPQDPAPSAAPTVADAAHVPAPNALELMRANAQNGPSPSVLQQLGGAEAEEDADERIEG